MFLFFRTGKLKLWLMLCKLLFSVNRMVITSTEATSPAHRMLTEALKPKTKMAITGVHTSIKTKQSACMKLKQALKLDQLKKINGR